MPPLITKFQTELLPRCLGVLMLESPEIVDLNLPKRSASLRNFTQKNIVTLSTCVKYSFYRSTVLRRTATAIAQAPKLTEPESLSPHVTHGAQLALPVCADQVLPEDRQSN